MEAQPCAACFAIKPSQRGLQVCFIQVFDEQKPYRQQVATTRPCGIEAFLVQIGQWLIAFCPLPTGYNLL
jgi:hypothetical protein